MGDVPDSLPGPRPKFFFAPDRVAKRTADWGRDGFERRLAEAWRPYLKWCDGWLTIVMTPPDDAAGSIIDVRGEINERMDDAVWRTLSDLAVTVLDTWDPTDEVEDDILPGVV